MKKCIFIVFICLCMIALNSAVSSAALIDELNYINEKSDIYCYVNFSRIMQFLSSSGININEFDKITDSGNASETDIMIKNFGLKLTDINELMIIMNTMDLDRKSGYIVLISFKNGRGIIPEEFRKNSIKLKTGTAYKASVEQDVVFTKVDDFFVIGPSQYID